MVAPLLRLDQSDRNARILDAAQIRRSISAGTSSAAIRSIPPASALLAGKMREEWTISRQVLETSSVTKSRWRRPRRYYSRAVRTVGPGRGLQMLFTQSP